MEQQQQFFPVTLQQAISISYEGEGLPAFGFLNGTVQELDDLPSTIMLNKTKATLNCSSGFMGISLQFQQPFYGIVYADYDRNRWQIRSYRETILLLD